ncbi:hypothetical protein GCM10009827_115450 [Dactylosporangium maewongense]|uniref:Tyr recombinase domain-containing protein n=1 Tax=Dactylosporangium maewongense TaxID=634393 RepID=A0ABN2DBT9_9ACTN
MGSGGRSVDLPGAVHLVMPVGVVQLDPERAVFDGMLEGWWRQQRSRMSRESTIRPRLALLCRFADFTGLYPWQWTPEEVEAFTTSLTSGSSPLAHSTVRSYQMTLRLFCEFVTDRRYGWAEECVRRFGQAPAQICHEWNTVQHLSDYEGRPGRRALTYDEVQVLFDAADGRAEEIRRRGRKGVLVARRDAVLLKTVYGFGLRRQEAARLDLVDLRRNPRAERYGRFGCVQVRYGKASRGGPPKRRTVLTVPEMDWVVEVLLEWGDELRPLFGPGSHPALFVTERQSRVARAHLDVAFRRAADDAGLPPELGGRRSRCHWHGGLATRLPVRPQRWHSHMACSGRVP